MAAMNWMSMSWRYTFSSRSYHPAWSIHCRRISMGGCAPYVSLAGMLRSSTMMSSTCSARASLFACASSSPAWSSASLSSTSLSTACFSWSIFVLAARESDAALSLAFLGATFLETSSYIIMACTHLHRPLAATEALIITSGVKSSRSQNLFTLTTISGSMLSLS